MSNALKLIMASGSGGVVGLDWSVSNSDPYIGWSNPDNFTQQIFAIPANSLGIGAFQYSTSLSGPWTDFTTTTFVSVPEGVLYNGVTYNGYIKSSPWTKGNTQYYQRHSNPPVSTSGPTNETTALNNNAGNFP